MKCVHISLSSFSFVPCFSDELQIFAGLFCVLLHGNKLDKGEWGLCGKFGFKQSFKHSNFATIQYKPLLQNFRRSSANSIQLVLRGCSFYDCFATSVQRRKLQFSTTVELQFRVALMKCKWEWERKLLIRMTLFYYAEHFLLGLNSNNFRALNFPRNFNEDCIQLCSQLRE